MAGRSAHTPGTAHRGRHIAPCSITAGQFSIHEPSLQFGICRRNRPFVSPPHRAAILTVWILRNTSSVIIPHLLSMKRECAALHKFGVFRRPSRRRIRAIFAQERRGSHEMNPSARTDSRLDRELVAQWITPAATHDRAEHRAFCPKRASPPARPDRRWQTPCSFRRCVKVLRNFVSVIFFYGQGILHR